MEKRQGFERKCGVMKRGGKGEQEKEVIGEESGGLMKGGQATRRKWISEGEKKEDEDRKR